MKCPLQLQCTPSCGPGLRHRVVLCKSADHRATLPPTHCPPAAKPPATMRCNLRRCPPARWVAGEWGEVGGRALQGGNQGTGGRVGGRAGLRLIRDSTVLRAVRLRAATAPGALLQPHRAALTRVRGRPAAPRHAAVRGQV